MKCPVCGIGVKLKNDKYTASQSEYGTAIIPSVDNEEIVFRYFNVVKRYKEGYKEYDLKYTELMREIFHADGTFTCMDKYIEDEEFRKCKLPDGEYRISWYTHKPLGTHASLSNDNVNIYTRNLSKYTKGTPAERVDLSYIYNHISFRDRYTAWSIMSDCYNGYSELYEYLIKIGCTRLACELAINYGIYSSIKCNEKSLIKMLNLSKETYRELLASGKNANIKLLNSLQKYTEFNLVKSRDREVFDKYFADNIWGYKKFVKYPITLNKFGKWADTQEKFNLAHYLDYLKMCDELGLDMKNSFVITPRELNSAHDMVTDMYNEMKFDAKLKNYADQAIKHEDEYAKTILANTKYIYHNDNLEIVVPKSTREIGVEGFKLRHCVAMYTQDIIKGEKTVLFLRQKAEPDVPFYTVEIVGDQLTQCKGYRNSPRTNDVETFIREFAKEKKLTIDENEYFAPIV